MQYVQRLLFPLYLFPVKLATYSVYYLVRLILKMLVGFLRLIWDIVSYPFRGFRNLLKSIVILAAILYMLASLFVIFDYLTREYGYYRKFACSLRVREKLEKSVVRIVGGYSEGSGFFISKNQVMTNFHVIANEPSPKIIFPDGTFVTPTRIVGDKDADLAVLSTELEYPDLVLPLPTENPGIYSNEPLLATGYPLGTELVGEATISKGRFVAFRKSKQDSVSYIQTDVSLVSGMSGGPLTDQCGAVRGINTQSLAGLSLFIDGYQAGKIVPMLGDQEIAKIEVDPSKSPEQAVAAFYSYLKARRMEEGYKLLSREYLEKTDFAEWTARFENILDVDIFKTEADEDNENKVFVRFSTKNWVDGEAERKYYEGTWETVLEDGVYKMRKSKIKEVEGPGWEWFY